MLAIENNLWSLELSENSLCNVLPIASENAQPSADSWNHFKSNMTSFNFKFFENHIANSNQQDNLLSSPISTSLVMGMIGSGSNAEMKKNLASTVHTLEDDIEQQACASKLMEDLKQMDVQIANILCLNETYRFNPNFVKIVMQNYKARAQEGGTVVDANQWCSQFTKGRVFDLITPEDMKGFFILANAFNFSGEWKTKFDTDKTCSGDFNTPAGKKTVRMMSQDLRTDYYEDDLCKAIKLPYKDSKVKMLLVLPKKMNDFLFLKDASFHGILKAMQEIGVKMALPKCKLAQQVDVRESLEKMGMKRIGGSSCRNIGDMSHSETMKSWDKLIVDKISQKTMLEMDEDGTTACTATVLSTAFEGGCKTTKSFICDQPYFVALVYEGMPLVYSVVRDPS
jgi:serine protease inhibitor